MAIHQSHKKFLRFTVSSRHDQFGLSAAPCVFTKCMAVITAFLQGPCIPFPGQLADKRSIQPTGGVQHKHNLIQISIIWSTFKLLVLLINSDKSFLSPVQKTKFIGVVLDSTISRAILPKARFQTMQSLILDSKTYPFTMFKAAGAHGPVHQAASQTPSRLGGSNVFAKKITPYTLVHILSHILSSLDWWVDLTSVCKAAPFIPLNNLLS